jgi:hypothetical protein
MFQHVNSADLAIVILCAWAFVHLGYELGMHKMSLRMKHVSEVMKRRIS